MNWDAIGAIGEILGAIAVFMTLVYLAVQIRQNTASVTTATYDSVMAGITDINLVVARDPEVASIVARGFLVPDSLNAFEAYRFQFILRSWANQWLKMLRLYERGALSPPEWERLAQEAAQTFALPGGMVFRARNHVFDDLYAEIDKYERREISDWQLGRGSDDDA